MLWRSGLWPSGWRGALFKLHGRKATGGGPEMLWEGLKGCWMGRGLPMVMLCVGYGVGVCC